MHRILGILRIVSLVPVALAATALFAMMVMTFFDVVLRSTANMPIEAASELTRLMMAVIVFATLPVVSARNGHISVDLLDAVFRGRIGRWRDALMALACGIMLWWPAERIVVLAERYVKRGDVTEFLGIPLYYPAWFVAVFTYLTIVALIARGLVLLFAPAVLERRR